MGEKVETVRVEIYCGEFGRMWWRRKVPGGMTERLRVAVVLEVLTCGLGYGEFGRLWKRWKVPRGVPE